MVYDAADGSGISGVVVSLSGPMSGSTTTGADGSYEFINLPLGTYTVVETNKYGYSSVTADSVTQPVTATALYIVDFGDILGPGPLHHFVFNTIGNQIAGQSFSITVRAVDQYGNVVTTYTGTANLTDKSATISPAVTGSF